MYMHIAFSDGSNPKLYIGLKDRHEMNRKIKPWRKNFEVKRIKTTKDGSRYYYAVPKSAKSFCTF